MQILQVELENIKSFGHAVVAFTPGVNAIVGHNGAGKSTLLEAIGFALFDSLPYKTSEFLRQGARTGTVAVTFLSRYDERPYRVERRFGGTHLYVVYDGELQAKLCEGKTDVLSFVRRHTGADPSIDLSRLFSDAIGVPQGTLTAVFLQTPSVRKGVFDALLQVDEYKTAFDRLLEPRNLLQERQREVGQHAAVLAARLERLPQLQASIARRTQEIDETRLRLCAHQERLQVVQTRRAELDSVRVQLDKLALQRARLSERQQTLAAQLIELQRLHTEALAARATVNQHLDGYTQYTAAQTQRQQLEAQLQQRHRLLAERAAADKVLALTSTEFKRIEDALTTVAQAEHTIVTLAPAVLHQAELEQALAETQLDLRRRAELETQIAAYRAEIAKLTARAQELATQLDEVQSAQTALQAAEQQLIDLGDQLKQQASELGALQAAAAELKQQNQTLSEVATTNCPVCEQPLTPQHRSAMLQRNETRLQELRLRYVAIQNTVKQGEAAQKQQSAVEKALQHKLRNLPRASELDDVHRRLAEAETALSAQIAAQTLLAAAPARMQELTSELATLDNPRQHTAVAAQQAAQRTALEAKLAQTYAQRTAAQQQLEAAQHALSAFLDLDAQFAELTALLAACEPAYQTVLRFRQQADTVETRATELERGQAAAQATQQDLDAVDAVDAKLNPQFDPVEFGRLSSEEQNLRGDLGALEERNGSLQQEQVRDAADLTVLVSQQAELAAAQTKQDKLGRRLAALELIRTLLRQSGPYITQALIRQISAGANQIFGEIMQDYSRQLVWHEDYGITLEIEGVSRQFAQLSGGEQMSAALAVRLALVREMSNIDIAFFDEPTANLDDIRREALARQIMNVKGFQQLFVISHDDTFEQATQNLIRVNRYASSSTIAD